MASVQALRPARPTVPAKPVNVAVPDLSHTLLLKGGALFLVAGRDGDIDAQRNREHGLYFHDTRYLDRAVLRLNGRRPVTLKATAGAADRAVSLLANPRLRVRDTVIEKGALVIRRERTLSNRMEESISVQNFANEEVQFPLELTFAARFETMFKIRGAAQGRRGVLHRPRWEDGELVFSYSGADGRLRTTRLSFDPVPEVRDNATVRYRLTLAPGREATIRVTATVGDAGSGKLEVHPILTHTRHFGQLEVRSSNDLFVRVLKRSFDDLELLVTREQGRTFFAAGVPWFVALFGRDSLITALQVLAYDQSVVANTLRLLASYQGSHTDPWREEQPGKILHELRVGEDTNLHEVPHGPYYGSVDATPLFVALLGEYVHWTGDRSLWHSLRPNVERALEWIDLYGDSDGDGLVDYQSRSPGGLANQGWKDSANAIVNRDGSLAKPPIALIEVQGYVYRAKLAAAWLYRLEGDLARAGRLEQEALRLRQLVAERFWMPRRRFLAVAIQQGGRRVESLTSNAGHALWAGIALPEHAREVARRLLSPGFFNGWGIRTLARGEPGYDPNDYQVGSVWPHDNSLIMAGLRRYGFDEAAIRVFTGIFEAAAGSPGHRLPEVLTGHARGRHAHPLNYPVACYPQAWSAGTIPYMISTALGLEGDATRHRLAICRPVLPDWLDDVSLHGLRVGEATVDLEFKRVGQRAAVRVLSATSGLAVEVLDSPAEFPVPGGPGMHVLDRQAPDRQSSGDE